MFIVFVFLLLHSFPAKSDRMSPFDSVSRSIIGAFCIAVGVTVTVTATEPGKESLDTVKKNIAKEKAVLVDVRERKEWENGHIDKAIFLPLSELRGGMDAEALATRLPKGKIVYTHCAVGKRAVTAEGILEKHGYEVRPLKEGYKELVQAGFKKADQ